MNITDYKEIWQVDAGGQIYETNFEEMTQWIFDGSLLPQDMVKRGNLRWIEARRVPTLMPFFNARDRGEPPPVFSSTTDAGANRNDQTTAPQNFPTPASFSTNSFPNDFNQTSQGNYQPSQNPFETSAPLPNFGNGNNSWQENQSSPSAAHINEPAAHEFNLMPAADSCSMHPEAAAAFLCGTCGNGFCPVCPKSYGGTVKICPFCGAMCKSVKEVEQKASAAFQYERDISKGFGIEDFFTALAYPFKYKVSLLVGAIMFTIFTLGQGAGSMGSIFLAGAGLTCFMLSNMLTFGIMGNVIENFAQGKIGGNFMPNFDDFSLWDDVVHPFFLSIGVYLVSFGLVLIIAIVLLIVGLNRVSSAITDSYQPENAKIVTDKNSPINNNPAFQKQKEFYGDGEMPDEEDIRRMQSKPGDTEEDVRRTNDLINQYRKKQLESGLGKSPDTERAERNQLISGIANSGFLVLLLVGAGILWGLFYMPAACCVAGYTRSFVATINPLVGIETIKLLGFDYVKIWLMGLALVIASFFVGMILSIIFMPFDLPTFGNMPAKLIGAMFSFYVSVVFSIVLGFALYKNADKMNLFKG